MDRHELPDGVTSEHVAQIHAEDLRMQDDFNCKGLTYWCDEDRKTAFCLIDAPDEESIREMHAHAHGNIPTTIIEVSEGLVESFMGKLRLPENEPKDGELVIADRGLRVLVMIGFKMISLDKTGLDALENFKRTITDTVSKFNGNTVTHYTDGLLMSFTSAADAIDFAMEIRSKFMMLFKERATAPAEIRIGIHAGIPVEKEKEIFEEVIKTAQRLSFISGGIIEVSPDVKNLAKNENFKLSSHTEGINIINPNQEAFLKELMDFIEKTWFENDLKTSDFTESLGISEMQLYRKVTSLTGKPLNRLLREYRLEKALKAMDAQKDNISSIAFENGFNSLAYFSKCFEQAYGIRPSVYLKEKFSD